MQESLDPPLGCWLGETRQARWPQLNSQLHLHYVEQCEPEICYTTRGCLFTLLAWRGYAYQTFSSEGRAREPLRSQNHFTASWRERKRERENEEEGKRKQKRTDECCCRHVVVL